MIIGRSDGFVNADPGDPRAIRGYDDAVTRRRSRRAGDRPTPSPTGAGPGAPDPRPGAPIAARLYWLLPLALVAVQAAFSLRAGAQIRYEELAESIRNPFWLEQRTIYDAASSNVGWYGALMLCYRTLGFGLHAARAMRVALHLASLLALADLLRRKLGVRRAWLPLAAIGLSPTLLYFNTMQASFGVDLQVLPICLWLLDGLDASRPGRAAVREALAAAAAMWAWMAYPAFVFFLPPLAAFWILRLLPVFRARGLRVVVPHFAVSVAAFAMPLAAALAYVKDTPLLLSGVFRGGGGLGPSAKTAWLNLDVLLTDLVQEGVSYHFELPRAELSGVYPVAALGVVVVIAVGSIARGGRLRLLALGAAGVLAFSLAMSAAMTGVPGIRRFTPVVAVIYALVVVAWDAAAGLPGWWRKAATAACLTLPFHHVLAAPANYAGLAERSPYNDRFLGSKSERPAHALATLVGKIQQADVRLDCFHPNEIPDCRYSEIFAAVAGSCLWNHLPCHTVEAFDPKSGRFVPVRFELWETYYWKH